MKNHFLLNDIYFELKNGFKNFTINFTQEDDVRFFSCEWNKYFSKSYIQIIDTHEKKAYCFTVFIWFLDLKYYWVVRNETNKKERSKHFLGKKYFRNFFLSFLVLVINWSHYKKIK